MRLMTPLNPRITDWHGQRVWLVGASTGIGAELARQLAAAGARVAVSARSADKLATLTASLGAGALALPADVTDPASLTAAHEQLLAQWGGLDCVMFLAGTYSPMGAAELDLDAAGQLFAINLGGAYALLAATLPGLIAQGAGHLVIVSSVAGYAGLPRAVAYGPSKAALINLAEALYVELRPLGVAVTLVNPGFVDTPLTQQNDFAMPALMRVEDAARATLAGLAAGDFEIHYPRRFTFWLKLLRLLPYRWQFAAVRRITQS